MLGREFGDHNFLSMYPFLIIPPLPLLSFLEIRKGETSFCPLMKFCPFK